tara:strand:- start:560 stop:1354 length:795 start_codon:yes stop_codon:yes gene_type:complete
MPRISAEANFNPDAFEQDILGIAATLSIHASPLHQHAKGQFLVAQSGCLKFYSDENGCKASYVLPPSRLMWIPGGVDHRVQVQHTSEYRSIYLVPSLCNTLPTSFALYPMNDLLRALIERISLTDFEVNWQERPLQSLQHLFLDEVGRIHHIPISFLTYPQDKRLAFLTTATHIPALYELAQTVGASEKTLSRIFKRETGLSYQHWKQSWTLAQAVERLAAHQSLTDITYALGFSSESAFCHFFKKWSRYSPRMYQQNYLLSKD